MAGPDELRSDLLGKGQVAGYQVLAPAPWRRLLTRPAHTNETVSVTTTSIFFKIIRMGHDTEFKKKALLIFEFFNCSLYELPYCNIHFPRARVR